MNTISNSWKGAEALWIVFWVHNILIGGLIVLGLENLEAHGPEWLALIYSLFVVVWSVWLTVAMWRCAFNANWMIWGYLIRALLILGFIAILLAIGAALF